MTKKIFFIDGLVNIAAAQTYEQLWKKIEKIIDYELYFLSPVEGNINWPFDKIPPNVKKVWSKGHFVRKLYSFLKDKNPTIIHIFFELRMFGDLKNALKFPLLLLLLRRLKAKKIVTLYPPLITKKTSGWKVIDDLPFKIPHFLISIFVKIFIKSICNFSDRIIVERKLQKNGLIEYMKIKEEKISVIHNAVSLKEETINQNKEKKMLERFFGKKIILCFGVIAPRKGQDVAIKAFNKVKNELSDYILVIAGISNKEFRSYEENLKKDIEKFDLIDRVFLFNDIENDEINILFKNSIITLYPYLPAIGGSGAFSFALQYNKPSIVTNINTFLEILDKKGALFVESQNENQLAESILKLVKDPNLRTKLKKEMQQIASQYSCENITNEHFQVYQKIGL